MVTLSWKALRHSGGILLASASVAWAAEKGSEQVSPFYGSLSHAIPIEVPGFRGLEPAIRHMRTGTPFRFRHMGMQKVAYVTRIGPDKFIFTSTNRSGRRIFTHFEVDMQYLRNLGITLPEGF